MYEWILNNDKEEKKKKIEWAIISVCACVTVIGGMAFFARMIGFNLQIFPENYGQPNISDDGHYQLIEMRSVDGQYAMYNVVQLKNDAGEPIEPTIVYTVSEIPINYDEIIKFYWSENFRDFCRNSTLGYYKYVYNNGSWDVYERQEDYSLIPLETP